DGRDAKRANAPADQRAVACDGDQRVGEVVDSKPGENHRSEVDRVDMDAHDHLRPATATPDAPRSRIRALDNIVPHAPIHALYSTTHGGTLPAQILNTI